MVIWNTSLGRCVLGFPKCLLWSGPLLLPSFLCGQEKVTYMDHVRPIFESRCLSCHSADKKKGGLDLSTYSATMAGGSGGICVEPGDLKSKLLGCVEFAVEPFMPPKSDKIPAKEIEILSKWIQGGVLETGSSVAKKKKSVDLSMGNTNPAAKPEGPPPMPEHLLLEPVIVTPRPNTIRSMAHSPWAPLVAVAGVRQVLLFHSESMELLGVLPFPEGSPERVGFSRNGSLVYAGGGTAGKKGVVAMWEVKSGRLVTVVGDETDSVEACDLSPDHKLVAVGGRSSKKVKILSTQDGSTVATIKKHTDWIMSVAFSPDGVLLATGDRNGGLYVWESATGNEFYNLKAHEKAITSISWRPDSNVVASGSEDGTVRLWEMGGGTQAKNWPAHSTGVLWVAYGADGSLVTSSRNGKCRIWTGDGTQKREVPVSETGSLIPQCGITPDGKRLWSGDLVGNAKFWDMVKEPKDAPPQILISNPPAIASRLAELQKEFDEKNGVTLKVKAELTAKESGMHTAKAELDKALSELAAMESQQGKATALKAGLGNMVLAIKASRETQTAELGKAQARLTELKKSVPAISNDQASRLQALPHSLRTIEHLDGSMYDLSVSFTETRVEDLESMIQKQEELLTGLDTRIKQADQMMGQMMAKQSETTMTMPERQKAWEAGVAVYNEAKAAYEKSAGVLGEVQRRVNKWLAAKQNVEVVALKGSVAKLVEQIDDVKAEIPALEAEVKTLQQQKAATPPPSPEDLAKLEKKLADVLKRQPEAVAELKQAEEALKARQAEQEVAWKKYLEILPQ